MGSRVRPDRGRRKLPFHLRVIQEERDGPGEDRVRPGKGVPNFLEEVT